MIITLVLIILILGLVSYITIKSNKKNRINQLFFVFIITLLLWLVFNFFENEDIGLKYNILFLRLDFVFGALILYLILVFALNFPSRSRHAYLAKILFLPTVIIGALSLFTDLIIKDISFAKGMINFNTGSLFLFDIAYHALYFGAAIVKWVKEYRRIRGTKKLQLKYILWGFLSTFIILIVVNLFFQNLLSLNIYRLLGNFSVIFFVIFTTYAIVRYRLMDIRIIIQKGIIYSVLLAIVFSIYALLVFILSDFFSELTDTKIFLSAVLASAIVVISFKTIDVALKKITDRMFFKADYNYQQILMDSVSQMNTITDLSQLTRSTTNTLANKMKLKKAIFFVFDGKKKCFTVASGIFENQKEKEICFYNNNPLIWHFSKNNQILIQEELESQITDNYFKNKDFKRAREQFSEMKKLQISLCLPVSHDHKLIGVLCLGDKLSDDPFFASDIKILEILSKQAGIALANALLLKNLEDIVRDRTLDLSAANLELQRLNRQLREINEAKSEFVSIASHQLKTPLTVIKGILSMLVSGDFGELTEEQKDYLTRASLNTEKLIKLVKDILNISKIETGKIQLTMSDIDPNGLVEEVVGNYSDAAKIKGLRIIFEKNSVPVINADRGQIEQVISNLLDNAIKYTEKGEIKIWMEKVKNNLIVKIKDTGVGITEEEIKNLFEKFIRGSSGKRFYTGGTGIGLFAARRIVEVHGGKIWAESEGLGKGSLFAFSLPLES